MTPTPLANASRGRKSGVPAEETSVCRERVSEPTPGWAAGLQKPGQPSCLPQAIVWRRCACQGSAPSARRLHLMTMLTTPGNCGLQENTKRILKPFRLWKSNASEMPINFEHLKTGADAVAGAPIRPKPLSHEEVDFLWNRGRDRRVSLKRRSSFVFSEYSARASIDNEFSKCCLGTVHFVGQMLAGDFPSTARMTPKVHTRES